MLWKGLLLIWSISAFLSNVTAQSCTQLTAPVYGSMQCTGNQENDRCEFQCDQGYAIVSSSSELRRCVCTDPTNCYWTGDDASCELIVSSCPKPSFTKATYTLIDLAPTGAIARVTVSPTANSIAGWSAVVIFNRALESGVIVESFSAKLSAVSSDGRAYTFINRDYNADISSRQQYAFTFIVRGSNLMDDPSVFTALIGFYDTQVQDGSCVLDIPPIQPLPTTTSASTLSPTTTSSSTTTSTTTTTTPATTTTTTAATTTTTTSTSEPPSNSIPSGCQEITYEIDNPGWNGQDGWNFIFRYKVPVGNWNDWIIKVVFSDEVTQVTTYDSVADGPHTGGRVWLFTPQSWNGNLQNQQMDAIGMSVTPATSAPGGVAIICNNGVIPDLTLLSTDGGTVVTASTTTTTTASTTTTSGSVVTVSSTPAPTLDPDSPSGILPTSSSQTEPNFTPSPQGERSPYDYNELLHKSILFYEAQRSGKLPSDNRIPWRGDSGLNDGCQGDICDVDLTGGWYDAGDFVKFGFPMAWSTTVLAWGMIEFQDAYVDAGEWDNALSMLKWATDYFLKAHVSANELYFQVGDPPADHASWGHPETMNMERPIFKVDSQNPGSEVAAETAAALAASSIVFKNQDSSYAVNLLNHAIQLYTFADSYRGNYHESVPLSDVGNYYRSWSGYNDELCWAAIWLYKATNEQFYLDAAIQQDSSLGTTEFSWDQKGPGAMVLLWQERKSDYNSRIEDLIEFAKNKMTTPGGLSHFSDWGSNRYAANFALIALMIAKEAGVDTTLGVDGFEYGQSQIHKTLGQGDGQRSYVVGFGTNPPQRPHHRASSCRSWTADPATQVCDYADRDRDAANPQILYGALVGGPSSSGSYTDDRTSYTSNEVAVDYNAGFQSAVAALKHFVIQGRNG